ncbi:MAG: hypothetical protein SNJ84_07680, partial [Verrucomicrobiia bacterium]
RAAASHPDQHPTPEAKAHAVRIAADLANAHRTLKKISSRLGALLHDPSSPPTRIGAVPEPWGPLLLDVGTWSRRCDLWLDEQAHSLTTLQKAMAASEGQSLLAELNTLRERLDLLEAKLLNELRALDAEWLEQRHDRDCLDHLRRQFAFAEKIRAQLEERFLRLAEHLT